MNQTISTLQKAYKVPILYELLRRHLVDQGCGRAARQTYQQQKMFLPDTNTSEFWDERFSETYVPHPMEEWRIKQVLRLIQAGQTVLNLGVGSGRLERQLLKQKKIKYTGTDITWQTLRGLQKDFPEAVWLRTPLVPLPLPDGNFDVVLLMEVLEHIKPSETFSVLNEIHRVLKPGGTAIITVPVNEGLELMLPHNPNSHMRLYSESLLDFEVREAGFQVKKVLRVSAFPDLFLVKHLLNLLFAIREPNNLIMLCQKK